VACDNCHSNSPCGETPFYWNDRYIEDALKQRIAELEQENDRLRELMRYAADHSSIVFEEGYGETWLDEVEELIGGENE